MQTASHWDCRRWVENFTTSPSWVYIICEHVYLCTKDFVNVSVHLLLVATTLAEEGLA